MSTHLQFILVTNIIVIALTLLLIAWILDDFRPQKLTQIEQIGVMQTSIQDAQRAVKLSSIDNISIIAVAFFEYRTGGNRQCK